MREEGNVMARQQRTEEEAENKGESMATTVREVCLPVFGNLVRLWFGGAEYNEQRKKSVLDMKG